MGKKSRRMALCGMMAALGTAIMLMGGVIPLATFCCPVLASLALIPVLLEYGRKWTLWVWAAMAALGLMLSPDKESALLLAFLGWYPALKPALDRIKSRLLRAAAKLGAFNLAAGAMLLCVAFVFRMDAVTAEYAAMGAIGFAAFWLLATVAMLASDRLLPIMALVYIRKIRPAATGGRGK